MLGVVGFMTLLALWWQFSQKRSASGMLEPGPYSLRRGLSAAIISFSAGFRYFTLTYWRNRTVAPIFVEEHYEKIVIAAAFIVSGLLVGCNQLTQYTVSEQEINQALEKHNNFQKTLVCRGLPMRISSSATSPARLGAKSRIKSLSPGMPISI